ncbi:MAG: tetratricopeptide repeat protein [Alphaproteobacteria bacterium]|jgi:tetratricopeptide (TPR) repeat protein|nr:tetratricopeptide repeat protein [Alphaproteobacteria bacterium]
MITDERGLALTTTSVEAARAFDDVVTCYLEYRLRIGGAIKAMFAADPAFCLGRVLVGYLMVARGTPEGRADARTALAKAEALAGDHLTERERRHLAALRAWTEGDGFKACRLWEEILVAWPRDLLALRLAHFQSFWLGTHRRMRNVVVRALPAWDASVPRYGDVLGMAAFGHEELGDYATAERLGRRAVELNPEDMWSIHAVAHVMEMQDRHHEGVRWLDYAPERWADRAGMRTHLWWHKALFHFERFELDAVLALYDEVIDPGEDFFYIDMQNCASLLARVELMGGRVGERWAALADRAAGWVDNHLMAFTDVHTIMPLARERRPEAARHLASLEAFAGTGDDNARRAREHVLPVCHAVDAFYRGDFATTVELLCPRKDDLAPIGGSHAQRDVFHLMLLEAALRSGRFDLARALAGERVTLRPHSHGSWLKYAEALEGAGDVERAVVARSHAA